ncbi:MAG: thioredoxin family protein [Planctomycetes bacterium]|nr:thioredoxin family protein [Planctomycetota bacterium]
MRDFNEAKRAAETARKDLVVVFTGRGWCQPCELLDQYVFQDQKFVRTTAEDFIFVELDFTFADTPEEKVREAKYGQLKDKYLAGGYPTMVLMDSRGVPFATIVGYSTDVTPDKMAEKLDNAQAAKKQRDSRFQNAKTSADRLERIMQLHAGIQAVAPLFGSLEEHGDDAVLKFYGKQVDEILDSSDEAAKDIRSFYVDRRKARDKWREDRATEKLRDKKVLEFVAAKDYHGAIDYLESILPENADEELYWRLQLKRQELLEASGDHEQALNNARKLLNSPDIPELTRESVLDSEARCLVSLKRGQEVIVHYDRRIEASAADSKRKLKLLYRKAQSLDQLGISPETIDAWKAHRDFAEPRTNEWLTGTVFLARALKRSGENDQAVSLFNQILATLAEAKDGKVELRWPWAPDRGQFIMLDAAECHIALLQLSDARKLIDQAAADIEMLRRSPHADDNERAEQLQIRVTELRSKIGNTAESQP